MGNTDARILQRPGRREAVEVVRRGGARDEGRSRGTIAAASVDGMLDE